MLNWATSIREGSIIPKPEREPIKKLISIVISTSTLVNGLKKGSLIMAVRREMDLDFHCHVLRMTTTMAIEIDSMTWERLAQMYEWSSYKFILD